MEGFSKALAVILAVLLLIMAPVRALAQAQTGKEEAWYEQRTREFVEEVGRLGYLSTDRYELFCKEIQGRGALWEIELIHAREKTGILEGNTGWNSSWAKGSSMTDVIRLAAGSSAAHIHTEDCYTHTHTGKTDDSRGRYYCTHTHTAACQSDGWSRTHFTTCADCNITIDMYCYEYDKYGNQTDGYTIYIPAGSRCPVCNKALSGMQYSWTFYYTCGFSKSTVTSSTSVPSDFKTPQAGELQSGWFREPLDEYTYGCYQYSVHDHESDGCSGYRSRVTVPVVCRTCGAVVGALVDEYAEDGSVAISYRPDQVYTCCGTGSSVDYSQAIEDYTYVCGKSSGWELICGGEVEAVTPICDQVMLSITPVESVQTIYIGDNLNTEVEVVCLSGNTFIVQGNTAFSAEKAGTFAAEVFLEGYSDTAKKQGRKTAEILVTVLPKEKTCDNGHVYTLNTDGSDSGCPVCRTTVEEITVDWEKPEIYKGDSLPMEGITVTYLDGHTELIKAGYEVLYDREKTGTVLVEFQYKNGTAAAEILVKPNPVSLKITPETQNVVKYQAPRFLTVVLYEDGSSTTVEEYELTGIRTDQVGVQSGTVSYTENGHTIEQGVKVNVLPLSATCAYGHTYDRDSDDVSWGCPICRDTLIGLEAAPLTIYGKPGDKLALTVIAVYQDGHTQILDDYECSYDPTRIGEQTVTIRWREKETSVTAILEETRLCPECGREIGAAEACPYCAQIPIQITAEPPRQTILWGEEPEFKVFAEYQDGHKERIYQFSHSFREGTAGTQEVTIYYSGMMAKIWVTVKPSDIVICPECGEEYSRLENREGCPWCMAELMYIEAEPEGGAVLVRGSTLKARVVLHYRAGNQEIIYSGYTIKNYEPMKTGQQEVQIWYQEKVAGFSVEVVEALTEAVCEKGHHYFLNQDGSDPGCPVCLGEERDYAKEYLDIYYTSQILEEL